MRHWKRGFFNNREENDTLQLKSIRQRVKTIAIGVFASYVVVALALSYWAGLGGQGVLNRDDNPRRVEKELQIRRGRIFDAHDQVLADSLVRDGNLVRFYPSIYGGQVVGYYSVRHGTSGLEFGVDDVLRGGPDNEWQRYWRFDVLHQQQIGQDVRTTLYAKWQDEAGRLFAEYRGAVVLLSMPDLAVRVMFSSPHFDPNALDDQFDSLIANEEAPLLNRATQALYQPGMALQPFLFAAGLEQDIFSVSDTTELLERTPRVNGIRLSCNIPNEAEKTWRSALMYRCPGPMYELGLDLGESSIREIYETFGLMEPPELPVEVQTSEGNEILDVGMAAVGQDSLTVSPMHIALATAVLANGGAFGDALLVQAFRDEGGNWIPNLADQDRRQILSADSTRLTLEALPENNGVAEHVASALSGPSGARNIWYIGLTPATNPRLIAVLIAEDISDEAEIQRVGQSLLDFARTQ